LPKLPRPPPAADLARIQTAWRVVPAGTTLFRVYFRGGPHPGAWDRFRHYGPTNARFDHHEPPPRIQDRGVLYAAGHSRTPLAEVFQASRTIDARHDEPWLVGFKLSTDVRLLDLTGLWPTRAGASMAITSGPRQVARRWSGAIYEAYPAAAGLWYGSSMDGDAPCVALFERAAEALPALPSFHRALADETPRAFLETCGEALVHYRTALTRERAAEVNRLQKAVEGANIKLAGVASDVLGVSGRHMLDALVTGATAPVALVTATSLRGD
jgi:hypothetical protein